MAIIMRLFKSPGKELAEQAKTWLNITRQQQSVAGMGQCGPQVAVEISHPWLQWKEDVKKAHK